METEHGDGLGDVRVVVAEPIGIRGPLCPIASFAGGQRMYNLLVGVRRATSLRVHFISGSVLDDASFVAGLAIDGEM